MIARTYWKQFLRVIVLGYTLGSSHASLWAAEPDPPRIRGSVSVVGSDPNSVEVTILRGATTYHAKTKVEEGIYSLRADAVEGPVKLWFHNPAGNGHDMIIENLDGNLNHAISVVLASSRVAYKGRRRDEILSQTWRVLPVLLANPPESEGLISFAPQIENLVKSFRDDRPTASTAVRLDSLVRTFQEADSLARARFSPDGEEVAWIDRVGKLALSGVSDSEFPKRIEHKHRYTDIAFLGSERLFASRGSQQPLLLLAQDKREEVSLPPGVESFLGAFPPGQLLVASGLNGALNVMRVDSREVVARFQTGVFSATASDISPDGQRLAAGTLIGDVYIWDLQTGREIARTQLDTDFINSLRFSSDGSILVVGTGLGAEGAVIRLAVKDRNLVTVGKPMQTQGGVVDLGVTNIEGNDHIFATTQGGRKAAIWRMDGTLLQTMENVGGAIDLNEDGTIVLPKSEGQGFQIWTLHR